MEEYGIKEPYETKVRITGSERGETAVRERSCLELRSQKAGILCGSRMWPLM